MLVVRRGRPTAAGRQQAVRPLHRCLHSSVCHPAPPAAHPLTSTRNYCTHQVNQLAGAETKMSLKKGHLHSGNCIFLLFYLILQYCGNIRASLMRSIEVQQMMHVRKYTFDRFDLNWIEKNQFLAEVYAFSSRNLVLKLSWILAQDLENLQKVHHKRAI